MFDEVQVRGFDGAQNAAYTHVVVYLLHANFEVVNLVSSPHLLSVIAEVAQNCKFVLQNNVLKI